MQTVGVNSRSRTDGVRSRVESVSSSGRECPHHLRTEGDEVEVTRLGVDGEGSSADLVSRGYESWVVTNRV